MKALGPVHPLGRPRKAWNNNECTSHASASKAPRRRRRCRCRHCWWVSRRYFHHEKCNNSPSAIEQDDPPCLAPASQKVARVLLFNLNPSSYIFTFMLIVVSHSVTSLDLIANYQVKVFCFYYVTMSFQSKLFLLCSFLYDFVVVLNTLLLSKQTNQNCSAAEETVLPLVITSPLMSCRDPGISPYLVCHLGLTIQ